MNCDSLQSARCQHLWTNKDTCKCVYRTVDRHKKNCFNLQILLFLIEMLLFVSFDLDLTKKFEQVLPPITYIDDDEQDHNGSKDPLNGSRNPLNGSKNPLNGSRDHLKAWWRQKNVKNFHPIFCQMNVCLTFLLLCWTKENLIILMESLNFVLIYRTKDRP
jgi:hypothetical protein